MVLEHSLKKKIISIFQLQYLKVIVEPPVKMVNFLNVNLNLNTGKFKVFRKENNDLLYVNNDSNHPPCILKNIPKSVGLRLSNRSLLELRSAFKLKSALFSKSLNHEKFKIDW